LKWLIHRHESHYNFIVELAAMRPSVEDNNVKTEQLGKGLYRMTADIANTGIFLQYQVLEKDSDGFPKQLSGLRQDERTGGTERQIN
jgi:hypothetical protein